MEVTLHLNRDYSILVIISTPDLVDSLAYTTSIHGAAFLVTNLKITPRIKLSGFDVEWKNTFMAALRSYST